MFCNDKIGNLSILKKYLISNLKIFKVILFDYYFTLLMKGDVMFYVMMSFYVKFKACLMYYSNFSHLLSDIKQLVLQTLNLRF